MSSNPGVASPGHFDRSHGGSALRIGVMVMPTDMLPSPAEIGAAAEHAGFESIWFPEHSHIPVAQRTPQGGDPTAPPLPDFYRRTYDQFVALTAVAATTSRIRVGTGICLLAQRDPIWTAKAVASLDQISHGRLEFGVGYGWSREEMEHHGYRFAQRRSRLIHHLNAAKALWTMEEATYTSEDIAFEPTWAYPKPFQQPHPPVHLGADIGPVTASRVAHHFDGWIPIGTRFDLERGRGLITRACNEIGRDPATVTTTVFAAPPDPVGLQRLRNLGVHRALLALPQHSAAALMNAIATWSRSLEVPT